MTHMMMPKGGPKPRRSKLRRFITFLILSVASAMIFAAPMYFAGVSWVTALSIGAIFAIPLAIMASAGARAFDYVAKIDPRAASMMKR